MANTEAKTATEICGLREDDLPVYNAEGVDLTLIRGMLSNSRNTRQKCQGLSFVPRWLY